jgi:hypothetical protein
MRYMYTYLQVLHRERERESPHLMFVIIADFLVDTFQNSPPTLPHSVGRLELKDAVATSLSRYTDSLKRKYYSEISSQVLSQYEKLRSGLLLCRVFRTTAKRMLPVYKRENHNNYQLLETHKSQISLNFHFKTQGHNYITR